jgi:hypothetical protein
LLREGEVWPEPRSATRIFERISSPERFAAGWQFLLLSFFSFGNLRGVIISNAPAPRC